MKHSGHRVLFIAIIALWCTEGCDSGAKHDSKDSAQASKSARSPTSDRARQYLPDRCNAIWVANAESLSAAVAQLDPEVAAHNEAMIQHMTFGLRGGSKRTPHIAVQGDRTLNEFRMAVDPPLLVLEGPWIDAWTRGAVSNRQWLEIIELNQDVQTPDMAAMQWQQETVGEHIMYTGGPSNMWGFHAPDGRLLVIGNAELLREVLRRTSPAEVPEAVANLWDALDRSNPVTGATRSPELLFGEIYSAERKQISVVACDVDFGPGFDVTWRIEARDDAAAEALKDRAERHIDDWVRTTEGIDMVEVFRKALGNADITQSDNNVSVKVTLATPSKNTSIRDLAVYAKTKLPGQY